MHRPDRNVSFATVAGMADLLARGSEIVVRGERTREILHRVTVLQRPVERFVFVPRRGNDPFAQIAEAIWVLAGRDDLTLLSRFVEELGQDWKVVGFDTFDGFPPPRSPLDMYAHPDCVFRDAEAVRRSFAGRNVEIVAGDVVETAVRLAGDDVVLAFVDTDNYTSAKRVVEIVADRVVVGGSIVFDHWTGAGRHLRTIGERMAARSLAEDSRYFNLHGTGVFLKGA